MFLSVIKLILSVYYFSTFASTVEVNGKLNFQDSKTPLSHAGLLEHKHISNKLLKRRETADETANNKDEFNHIGIVCISGGCNTTSKSDDSSVIQTDVLVRVKTKVETSKNNTNDSKKLLEETPEIPVVVGYKGVSRVDLDRNINTDGIFNIPSLNGNYNTRIPNTYSNQFHPSSHSFANSFLRGHNNGYYPSVRRPTTFYPSVSNNAGDANVKDILLPPLIVRNDGIQGNDEQDIYHNGDEIRIPYFEPSYSSHYYGENPPQQYVSVSRKYGAGLGIGQRGGFNANSFIPDTGYRSNFNTPTNNNWKPSVYNIKDVLVPQRSGTSRNENCICQEEQSRGVLLLNSDNYSNRRFENSDPGTQINDKLAPLN